MKATRLLILVLIMAGCTSENEQPDTGKLGYGFFPLEKGSYRIYNVSSTEYLFAGENILRNYQLKEVVADTFTNLEGGISFRIEWLSRDDENESWVLDSVGYARRNTTQAVQVNNNVPELKLVFPVRENKTWDANAYNDKDEDEYKMAALFQPFPSADSVAFENTVTVTQEEVTDNILFRDVRKEVYADSVGLIYKEAVELQYCADEDCLGEFIVESGFEYRQHLSEYGKE